MTVSTNYWFGVHTTEINITISIKQLNLDHPLRLSTLKNSLDNNQYLYTTTPPPKLWIDKMSVDIWLSRGPDLETILNLLVYWALAKKICAWKSKCSKISQETFCQSPSKYLKHKILKSCQNQKSLQKGPNSLNILLPVGTSGGIASASPPVSSVAHVSLRVTALF